MIWIVLTLAVPVIGILFWLLLKKRFPRLGKAVLIGMLAVFCLISAVSVVCWTAPDAESEDPDYALLLGYALKDGQ